MKDPTEVLMQIVSKVNDYKSVSQGDGPWRFRDGVKFYPPGTEARCPNCQQWIPVDRAWLIDEKFAKLIKCWDGKGNPLVQSVTSERIIVHPHIAYNKSICLGDAGNASNSLFASIAKGKHYYSTEMWFYKLGHRCPVIEMAKCEVCGEPHPSPASEYYGDFDKHLKCCSVDCANIANLFRCARCLGERPFYETRINRQLCEACYREIGLQCDFCDNFVFPDQERRTIDDEVVCEECRPDHSIPCEDCGEMTRHSDMSNGNLRCRPCRFVRDDCHCDTHQRGRNLEICTGCLRWRRVTVLERGLCWECRRNGVRPQINPAPIPVEPLGVTDFTPLPIMHLDSYFCSVPSCLSEVDNEGDYCDDHAFGCRNCGARIEWDDGLCDDCQPTCGCDCGCGNYVDNEGEICDSCPHPEDEEDY